MCHNSGQFSFSHSSLDNKRRNEGVGERLRVTRNASPLEAFHTFPRFARETVHLVGDFFVLQLLLQPSWLLCLPPQVEIALHAWNSFFVLNSFEIRKLCCAVSLPDEAHHVHQSNSIPFKTLQRPKALWIYDSFLRFLEFKRLLRLPPSFHSIPLSLASAWRGIPNWFRCQKKRKTFAASPSPLPSFHFRQYLWIYFRRRCPARFSCGIPASPPPPPLQLRR